MGALVLQTPMHLSRTEGLQTTPGPSSSWERTPSPWPLGRGLQPIRGPVDRGAAGSPGNNVSLWRPQENRCSESRAVRGIIMNREVIRLEEEGWQALSSSPAAATEFYEDVLDERVVMLLPGNTLLDDRAQILQSMAGQPWQAYDLEQLVLHEPADDIAIVVYGATAHRQDSQQYSALVSSTYVRRADGWKLTMHTQTPR